MLFAAVRGMADEINPSANRSGKTVKQECDALADAVTFLLSEM